MSLDLEYTAIALAPNADTTMPITNTAWQTWYENVNAKYSSFSFASPDSYAMNGGPRNLWMSPMLPKRHLLSFLSSREPLQTRCKSCSMKDAESTKTSGFDALLSTYFPSSSANLTVRATEQIDDVVHIFNVEDQGIHTEQSEVKVPMQHLGVGSSVMEDNTVVTVSGIVRFPSDRTQDVICGLAYATIKTYIKSCNDFNGCEYEEPMQYTADELGMFEIAITPGETVLFAVSYDGHDICFAGTDISDGCIAEDLSSSLVSGYTGLDFDEQLCRARSNYWWRIYCFSRCYCENN
jgi:hypothetical protein